MLPARTDVGPQNRPVGEERLWGEAWNSLGGDTQKFRAERRGVEEHPRRIGRGGAIGSARYLALNGTRDGPLPYDKVFGAELGGSGQ